MTLVSPFYWLSSLAQETHSDLEATRDQTSQYPPSTVDINQSNSPDNNVEGASNTSTGNEVSEVVELTGRVRP
jgi:hypothetical protein